MTTRLFSMLIVFLFYFSASAQMSFRGGQLPIEPEDDKSLSPYFKIISDDPDLDEFPLLETSADVSIAGVIADVTVKQVYKNDGKKAIEAIYVFPASTRAAVYSMVMKIGERTIVAEIKEKGEARQIYEDAKEEGRSASLLEQSRPNVFTMNVANIMPGDVISVEMKYTELLVPEENVYEFSYPTVVGPRYTKPKKDADGKDETFTNQPYTHEGEEPSYKFDLNVNINPGLPISEIKSESHEIDVDMVSENIAEIKLKPGQEKSGNKDFILKYKLTGDRINTGLLLHEGRNENFFMLMVQPPKRVNKSEVNKREYIFVVDISGSMNGFPLDVSKQLMNNLLLKLNPEEKFNILMFAGGSKVLSEQSLAATNANIFRANKFLGEERGGGGTELLPALKRALALPTEKGVSRQVIIISDGYVNVEREAFDLIRDNLDNSNYFAFGIGSSVNRYIIEGISRVGTGQSFIITSPKDAAEKADLFRKYVQSPVMTDIKVEFNGFKAYDYSPKKIPSLFAYRPIVLFGKWKGSAAGEIKISGVNGDQPLSVTIPVKVLSSKDESEALKYLWARNKLLTLADYNKSMFQNETKEEITKLGLDYNLLTEYTSFVAVDSEVRNNDSLTTVNQPLPLPEGVGDKALGLSAGAIRTNRLYSKSKVAAPAQHYAMYAIEEEVKEFDADHEYLQPDVMASYNSKELVKLAKKYYPEEARKSHTDGVVLVNVQVDEKGNVKKTEIFSASAEVLKEAAFKVIKDLSFIPASKGGKQIESWVKVPVKFELDPEAMDFVRYTFQNNTHLMENIGSGVLIYDKSKGSTLTAMPGMTVILHYTAYSPDGTKLAGSNESGMLKYKIGQKPSIIKGLNQAIIGMKRNGVRLIVIPPEMQMGTMPAVPRKSGEDLIFEVELQDIEL